MTKPGKQAKSRRGGKRLVIRLGHHHHSTEPAVVIIDALTGNVTPVSAEGAFAVADRLVDEAERLEARTR